MTNIVNNNALQKALESTRLSPVPASENFEDLNTKIQVLNDAINEKDMALSAARAKIDEMGAEYTAIKVSHDNIDSRMKRQITQISNLQSKNEELVNQLTEADQKVEELNQALEESRRNFKDIEEAYESFKEDARKAEDGDPSTLELIDQLQVSLYCLLRNLCEYATLELLWLIFLFIIY
jgi:chromosome segregation ATPase